jgi:glycosyltransferase involved in cell wall biosynthesis
MINREFCPLNIDLRYILVLLGLILIIKSLKDIFYNKEKLVLSTLDKVIFCFYLFTFLSNIFWIFNGIKIDISTFLNIFILNIFNFITICIFVLYKKKIDKQKIMIFIIISILFLLLSMLLLGLGIPLSTYFNDDYKWVTAGKYNHNFLGLNYRIGGFAQDPNYASLSLIIASIVTLPFLKKNKYSLFIILICFIGILFSASKTAIIGLLLSSLLAILFIIKKHKIASILGKLKNILVIIICISPYVIIKIIELINYKSSSITMGTRFEMWQVASDLFNKNILFGNGLTSFRSYFDSLPIGWYVQCHSTMMQILSETGIICFILFIIIFIINIKNKNPFCFILLLTYLIWCVDFESVYLSFFPFFIYLVPLLFEDSYPRKNNKVLFVINSLGKGGAERVVANMANKMSEIGHDVIIILASNNIDYKLNDKIQIICLNKKQYKNRFIKLIISWIKFNIVILKMRGKYEFQLITSHLPLANFLCRFSVISNQTVYVIHNVFSAIDTFSSRKIRIALQILYNRRKIVTVSNGVKDELIKKYGIEAKNITTIYNPIDLADIAAKSMEKIEQNPYILFCGRLTSIKRPNVLLDAFFNGNFYKKYDLIYIGEGELFNKLKGQAIDLKISTKVKLMGWQENVYKWMANAELLVLCSEYEAFPMTILEAFACNCKVVSSDCDFGPREIMVNEYKNYLAEDDAQLPHKMEEALKVYPNNMLEIAKQYDAGKVIEQYIKTYNQ